MSLIGLKGISGFRQVRSQHRPGRINTIPIVAIGASAGGLDAVLAKLPPDPGMGCGGLGLVSMRERAHLASGELSIDAKPGRGTRIKLDFPLLGSAP